VIRAAIFDLDGLLIDSEPLWRAVEVEVFRGVGVPLTEEMCRQTTGLRVDAVVEWWHARHPWRAPAPAAVAARIVDRMVEAIAGAGETLARPGVEHAIGWARAAGLRLAVASSSPLRIVEAALRRLGLADRFEVVRSAEGERWGKPHPAVFLATADELGVEPTACLVFEDSLAGLVAAKAARMRCVCVPETFPPDPRFALADACLPSLRAVSDALLAAS